MKTQRFSLLCALILPMVMITNVQAQRPANVSPKVVVYGRDQSVLVYEDPEVAARTDTAINKLSATCQNVSSLQKLQYAKINELLGNNKIPVEAKQILVDSRISLVFGIETFRKDALLGKVEERSCDMALISLDKMDKQLDKISISVK